VETRGKKKKKKKKNNSKKKDCLLRSYISTGKERENRVLHLLPERKKKEKRIKKKKSDRSEPGRRKERRDCIVPTPKKKRKKKKGTEENFPARKESEGGRGPSILPWGEKGEGAKKKGRNIAAEPGERGKKDFLGSEERKKHTSIRRKGVRKEFVVCRGEKKRGRTSTVARFRAWGKRRR